MTLIILLTIFGFITAILVAVYIWLHKTLNHRVTADLQNENKYTFKREKRYFTTSDGIKIAAWYVPAENSKGVVILVHGFKEKEGGKALMLGHAEYLHDAGYTSLIIDQRAVGESEGNKTSWGVNEWKDVDAAYEYLNTLPENQNKKIGCLGLSVGGSTCIVFAGVTGKADFLIAAVSFYDLNTFLGFQMMKRSPILYYASKPLISLLAMLEFGWDYQNHIASNNIHKIKVPTLIMSAEDDKTVDPQDSIKLYEAANDPKEIWKIKSDHDIFAEHPEEFKSRVLEFLKSHL